MQHAMMIEEKRISASERQKYIDELYQYKINLLEEMRQKNEKIKAELTDKFDQRYKLNGKPFEITIKLSRLLQELSTLTNILAEEMDLQIYIEHLKDDKSLDKIALNISSGIHLDNSERQLFKYKGIVLANNDFNEIQANGQSLYEILHINPDDEISRTINGNARRRDFDNIMCQINVSTLARFEHINSLSKIAWYPSETFIQAVTNCADYDKTLGVKPHVMVLKQDKIKKNKKSA